MVDTDAARVQMHFAADRARQKRVLAAIFAVADNGVANRGHMHAQLVGAAGIGLQFDPGGGVSGAFDDAITGAGRLAVLFIDMHFLAAAAGLLANGQVDETIGNVRHTDDQRPIHLARGA